MKKRPRDPNVLAKAIVGIATGQVEDREPKRDKNEAAAALGRKGGKARAEKMSSGQRSAIAKKAAASRWKRD